MTGSLAFWRSAFAIAVHASARFPRLVPTAVVEYVDRRFYAACLRETLRSDFMRDYIRRRATEEYREATADTMPAPSEPWDCLVGGPELSEQAGEEHAAMVDLQPLEVWPSSRQRGNWEA